MLSKDEQLQQRWREEETRESHIDRRELLLAKELESHAVTVAPDAGYDISNLTAQMGTPMTCQQVMEKLKQCNSRLHFERSIRYPELTGVYLLIREQTPTGSWVDRKQHLFGMESGIMPEFSIIHKTKTRVANQELFGREEPTSEVPWKEVDTFRSETRGWRTVLVRLLHNNLITEYDVERHFGWAPSRDSERWYNQTR